MPRQARLDCPGTLHHVILRGIEKRNIFDDDSDREEFITRLGKLAAQTETKIFAWTLMDNHVHILMRSSEYGLPHYMRRLLTGYAITYNRRHSRHGYLFQNRYKSIICEEEAYFLELVRYIHLNPFRANLVKGLPELDHYRWCGHAALMGNLNNPWQQQDDVLRCFGITVRTARAAYRLFMMEGKDQGRRPELTGGNMVRSQGEWAQVKPKRVRGEHERYDNRVLGDGEFVEQVMQEIEENLKHQFTQQGDLSRANQFILEMCDQFGITPDELNSGSRRAIVSQARAQIARELVSGYSLSLAETARQLGVTTSAISKIFHKLNPEKVE